MSDRVLEVWCFGEIAGQLHDDGHRLTFSYSADWIAGERPPISQSLPLDMGYSPDEVRAFFEGLLPEGDLRKLLAQRLGISANNEFSILEQIGGDCAGALSLYPVGGRPGPEAAGVRWLDDAALASLVIELPTRPMAAGPDGEFRLSLAGAQDKLPVVVGEGRVGLPVGGQPSTHILKTPIKGLPATVLNEAMWSRIGKRLGLATAPAIPHRVGETEMLLVERYDRYASPEDGDLLRLHQEDFCQALGIPSNRKYENEGGPSLTDCFDLLRRAATRPAAELPRLLDAWALSFIAANHDAHGKNYSLLYGLEGVSLAPIYDVLNSAAYWKVKPMDRKMAVKVGGENRPDYLRRRHLDRMLADAGLGAASARRRLRSLASRAPAVILEVRREIAHELWDDPHLDRIVDMSTERAAQLVAIIDEPA
ncbi:MAG: type II toxin-antitoxin system HipA family toxin [Patulibacter sp.]|nr:type II toxin-antitoxin system HipA family toxin [Patulibacter sp.]